MTCCTRCGGTGREPGPANADISETLRAACIERGIWISPDGMVREAVAAELIGVATKTMRNWRYADQPIPFTTRAGHPLYKLHDLADWLARSQK
ncbi:hypothetical protein [Sphingobium estronivorans]|uniref:hypothetical protein n=1 Tax=Sphingobium estronivorans TaxID=1577690 RepID=UPI001238E0CA|nr:hypothetical protein [Sphingobium estronivorans]